MRDHQGNPVHCLLDSETMLGLMKVSNKLLWKHKKDPRRCPIIFYQISLGEQSVPYKLSLIKKLSASHPGGGQPLIRALRRFECQSAQLVDCICATSLP